MSRKEQLYFALGVFASFIIVSDLFSFTGSNTQLLRIAAWLGLILLSVYKVRKIRQAEKDKK